MFPDSIPGSSRASLGLEATFSESIPSSLVALEVLAGVVRVTSAASLAIVCPETNGCELSDEDWGPAASLGLRNSYPGNPGTVIAIAVATLPTATTLEPSLELQLGLESTIL